MSLKEIKDNQELINAYNNYMDILKEYQNIKQKQVDELDQLKKSQNDEFLRLKDKLIEKIGVLTLNENFNSIASDSEKKQIQDLLAELS
jgi:response regulator of citrate/malate metabolism